MLCTEYKNAYSTSKVRAFLESEDISPGPHNFIGLFEVRDVVGVRIGFRLGLKLEGFVVIVRGWVIYNAYESPPKDRRIRMCVCLCIFVPVCEPVHRVENK